MREMNIKKINTGLTLPLLLASGLAVSADINKGLEAYNSGDYKAAITEWIPLAEQGIAVAQYNVGIMYDTGKGVPENDKTAVKWYSLAAALGNDLAQFNLGLMYDRGEGVEENDKTAVKWYVKAAKQESAKAQNQLGLMYSQGKGVSRDSTQAYMWYNLASYNGHETSSESKRTLASSMTPANISKAQDMSSRCLESGYKDCDVSTNNNEKSSENKVTLAKNTTAADISKAHDMSSHCSESGYKKCEGSMIEVLLTMEFDKDCWVEIKDGYGKMVLSDLYSAGMNIEQVVTAPIKVILGRSSGVTKIMFDGQAIDLEPYTSRDIARLTLSK